MGHSPPTMSKQLFHQAVEQVKSLDQGTVVRLVALPFALALGWLLLPYLADPQGIRKYPGPFSAALTRGWLVYWSRVGERSIAVHEEHKKHGKFVRITPYEVSIADPRALPIVYAHGSGSLKSEFYDAFVANKPGLFNTRDRGIHSRKRKIVSHTWAQKSVLEFEPYISHTVRVLIKKWDEMCEQAEKSGMNGGWAKLDLLEWFNAEDVVPITTDSGKVIHQPAVQILNERGEYSATQGSIAPWIRPFMPRIDPWFARGKASVTNLTGIARTRVNERLKTGAGDRRDILYHLENAKDSDGKPMPRDELIAEALTQLIAGSDTTSNSSCAISFYLTRNPEVKKKLQKALDEAFGPAGLSGVIEYEDAKKVKYLEASINEALRMHSTSGMGLPRIMTQDTEVLGEVFKAGTVLSVPSYTIHHLKEIWGDPEVYRPERWLGPDAAELEKSLNVFSFGPRSCVGRNVAML